MHRPSYGQPSQGPLWAADVSLETARNRSR
jgi:hypothetical protein